MKNNTESPKSRETLRGENEGSPKSRKTFWGKELMDKIAVKITGAVGTMWCAVIFTLVALISLPDMIAESARTNTVDPIIQWITQTFLQLVLLSIILRGQNIASDKQEHMIRHIKENTAKTEAAAKRIEHIVKMIESKAEKELEEIAKGKKDADKLQ